MTKNLQFLPYCCSLLPEVRTQTQAAQDPGTEAKADVLRRDAAVHWIASYALLSLICYRTQDH